MRKIDQRTFCKTRLSYLRTWFSMHVQWRVQSSWFHLMLLARNSSFTVFVYFGLVLLGGFSLLFLPEFSIVSVAFFHFTNQRGIAVKSRLSSELHIGTIKVFLQKNKSLNLVVDMHNVGQSGRLKKGNLFPVIVCRLQNGHVLRGDIFVGMVGGTVASNGSSVKVDVYPCVSADYCIRS